jgi:ferredoxin
LPIAFKEREVSFFINNNIPNILGHIFDLNDIIMGARIEEGSDGIEIGKPILKNVTGYSLKILINKDIADKNSSYYLKIFPKMNEFIPYKYIGFKTKKPQVLDKLLNVFGKSILNLIVNRSGEFLDLCVIVYNDKETLSAITKFLDSNSIKSSLANEIDIKQLDTKKIILVTLSKTPNFKEFDGFPEYTYSYLGKCLALPLKDKEDLDGIVKKVKSRLNSIEAIRKISGKGNEYLFVIGPLKKQLEITKELVEYLKAPGEIKMKGSFKPGYESNILKENEFEREIFGEIRKCSRCGLCLYGCPQYQYKKEEQYSPRGVVSMIKSNRDKRFVKDFFKGCIKKCNNARPCESLCPTGLNFSKLISIYTKTCNYG